MGDLAEIESRRCPIGQFVRDFEDRFTREPPHAANQIASDEPGHIDDGLAVLDRYLRDVMSWQRRGSLPIYGETSGDFGRRLMLREPFVGWLWAFRDHAVRMREYEHALAAGERNAEWLKPAFYKLMCAFRVVREWDKKTQDYDSFTPRGVSGADAFLLLRHVLELVDHDVWQEFDEALKTYVDNRRRRRNWPFSWSHACHCGGAACDCRRALSPTRKSFVYFVWDELARAVKIGKADDVAKRLASLQTASARELRVVATKQVLYDRALKAEGALHSYFERDRVRPSGEWFYLSGELVDLIGAWGGDVSLLGDAAKCAGAA